MSKADAPDAGRTIEEPIDEALSKRYLAYALSTITSRALPDVRDGLKPVHRRILYVMRQLKLAPDEAYKKIRPYRRGRDGPSAPARRPGDL